MENSTARYQGCGPETIVRVHGQLHVVSDQAGATERPFGAVGLAVVSNESVAIGVTAVPTPYGDADSDFWFMHRFWAAPMHFASAVGISMRAGWSFDLSSKAMRKVTTDQTVILVMENGDATGGVRYRLDLRILTKVF